ncbi:MAG: hypothetical protein ABSE51_10665 [Terracidiphilus sp.]|jgi:hypothetical protein
MGGFLWARIPVPVPELGPATAVEIDTILLRIYQLEAQRDGGGAEAQANFRRLASTTMLSY